MAYRHGLSINIDQDYDTYWAHVSKPDLTWLDIDGADHLHKWLDQEVPTCTKTQVPDNYYDSDGELVESTRTEYRCKSCSAVVRPKTYMTEERFDVAGLTHYVINGIPTTKARAEKALKLVQHLKARHDSRQQTKEHIA
jgi:hypothetical protein